MTSVNVIIVGMMLLAASLATRHMDAPLPIFIAWAGGWIGSILVIVGTGKLFFVDD
jgi:hypothetical protein